MAFKIKKVTTAVWPVAAPIPQDGGTIEDHHFFVRFNRLAQAKFDELSAQGDQALLGAAIAGVGENEDSVKADKKATTEMLAEANYRAGLYSAYLDFIVGNKAKN
ncbi:MAG: hypothetical protein COB35_05025 [Gammaproteobacteria bacterium]|nr:MAG: hypothetical protein COB35_05025 [Gammaproteobacteria bacterium]